MKNFGAAYASRDREGSIAVSASASSTPPRNLRRGLDGTSKEAGMELPVVQAAFKATVEKGDASRRKGRGSAVSSLKDGHRPKTGPGDGAVPSRRGPLFGGRFFGGAAVAIVDSAAECLRSSGSGAL